MRYEDWQLKGPIGSPLLCILARLRGRDPKVKLTKPPLRVRMKRTWDLFWMINELGWPELTRFEFECLKRICPVYLAIRRFFWRRQA
jgi:hypothetical protein